MTQLTSKSFLAALRSAELLSQQRMAEVERDFAGLDDPKTLAVLLVRSGELTSWQAKFLLSGRDTLRVGNYILRERLRHDELGDRILALHERLNRLVDLQILPPGTYAQSPAFEHFLSRASAVARLDHPNLIHVYDIDLESGRHYLVSEHFEARTVNQIFKTGAKLSWKTLVLATRQWLDGLSYAHAHQVVHGDLSSRSLLLADDGTAKIGNLAMGALARALGVNPESAPAETDQPRADYRQLAEVLNSLIQQAFEPSDAGRLPELLAIVDNIARLESPDDVPPFLAQLDQWLPPSRVDSPAPFSQEAASSTETRKQTEAEKPQPAKTHQPTWRQPQIWVPAVLIGILLLAVVMLLNRSGTTTAERTTTERDSTAIDRPPTKKPAPKNDSTGEPSFVDQAQGRPVGGIPESMIDAPAESKQTSSGKPNTDSTKSDPPAADATDEISGSPDAQNEPAAPVLETIVAKKDEAAKTDQESTPTQSASEKKTSKSTPPKNSNEGKTPSPFAKTPPAVRLPPVSDLASVPLAEVDPGPQYLLACSLVADENLTRRTKFQLEKATGDQGQRWSIVARPSSGSALTVAELSLADGWLRFQWLADAARDATIPFLQNCLLEMTAGTETFQLRLREPATLGVAKVSAKEPQSTLTFDLEFFPTESDAIQFEYLKVTETKFSEEDQEFSFIPDPDDRIIPPRGSLYLLFSEKSERFLFVEISAKAAKQSAMTATLRVYQEPKPRPYSEKLVAELDQFLQANAAQIGIKFQQASAYEAPDGSKRDHAKFVKQLGAELELAQQQVAELAVQKRRAAVLFDKPIRCRAFYRLGEVEVDVATWDGKVHSAK